ncbi:MAG: acetyltransferase [Pseudomonadales bacterium]|nr:arylamine N-acetyltransferase [Pseudomonadales bacterium]NIX09918.1 acetyltransferase [Pseudomonadales bacterium]
MLDDYLDRIGHEGPLTTDLATLAAIHRAHITAIPYENLEIQLGRENTLDESDIFAKIVERRRGGWCYEMNGLLTRALGEIGFSTRRVSGAVGRDEMGSVVEGNHLVGLVDLDRTWVVDVGLADGPLEPFPLEARSWREGPLEFRLEQLDSEWWRFHNHVHGLARTFDFSTTPRTLFHFQDMCRFLQTDPSSPFVEFAIASRRRPSGFDALRDTTWFHVEDGRLEKQTIDNEAKYGELLEKILGTDLGDEVGVLWGRAEARSAKREASKDVSQD